MLPQVFQDSLVQNITVYCIIIIIIIFNAELRKNHVEKLLGSSDKEKLSEEKRGILMIQLGRLVGMIDDMSFN
jgi:hypothetical protein